MDCGQMIKAEGGGLPYMTDTQFNFDKDSSSYYHYGHQVAHHLLYAVANSSALIEATLGSVP